MANLARHQADPEAYLYGKNPLVMQSYTPRIIAKLIEGMSEQHSGNGPSRINGLGGDHRPSRRRQTREQLAIPADD